MKPWQKPRGIVVLLLLLGSLESIGYLTGINTVTNLGRFTGASPFANVFTEYDGYRYWVTRLSVTLVTDRGEILAIGTDGEMGQTGFHHVTQMVHSLPLSWAMVSPHVTAFSASRFFCHPESFLLRHLGLGGTRVSEFRLRLRNQGTVVERSFRCEK